MYDLEKLTTIIKDIEKDFAELEKFGLHEDNLTDSKTLYASSMALFGIISRTIDLAEEIIVKNEFGMPATYKNYFEVLNIQGVIGKELSADLQKLTNDRNFFAHEYFTMKRNYVLDVQKRIYAVKKFLEIIKKIIRKEVKIK